MARVHAQVGDRSLVVSTPNTGLLGLLQSNDGLALASSAAVVFGVTRLVPSYDNTWYQSLKKPRWNPPNWVFPAVWIPLKLLQSAALYLVIKHAPTAKDLALPLGVFGAHLALGNAWNVTFFGRHKLEESLPVMGAFWLSTAGTIASFNTVSEPAATLVAPTLAWVTIAAALNYEIVRLNNMKKSFSDVVKGE